MPRLSRGGRVAAADFDGRWLRVILADSGGRGLRVVGRSARELPGEADPSDPLAVGAMLDDELRRMNFHGAGLVMCVPRSQAVLKPVQLPPNTPAQELAAMVNFQVAKELPFPAEDAVVDFTTESHYDTQAETATAGEQDTHVLAAAIRLSVVDHYRRIAEAAGAKLLGLALRPYADLRCVELCEPQAAEGCFALVHLTSCETEIDVISQRSLTFSRAAVRRLPTAGEPDVGTHPQHVEPLVQEIARSLQSYHTIHRGAQIEAVLLAGGTGLEGFVAEKLAKRLGVPCRILTPPAPTDGESVGSEYVSTLGLAASDPAGGAMPFDFLNPKRPPVVRDARKTRTQLAALAGIVLLLAMFAGRWLYLGHKEKQIQALAKTNTALEDELKSLQAVARRVEAVERWRDGDRKWLDNLAHLNALLPSSREVYLTGLDAKADGSMSLMVQARDSGAITNLGESLAKADYSFRPGQVKTGNDRHGYVYGTTVRVMTSPELAVFEPSAEDGASAPPEPQPAAVREVAEPAPEPRPAPQPAGQVAEQQPGEEPPSAVHAQEEPSEAEQSRQERLEERRRAWRERMRARRQTMQGNAPPDLPEDAPRGVWNRPNPMRDRTPPPGPPQQEGGQ